MRIILVNSDSRLTEIFHDECHLTGGEKLGVLAEGALLQGFMERTAALYPAVEAVYSHVWVGIGKVYHCKLLLAVASYFHSDERFVFSDDW